MNLEDKTIDSIITSECGVFKEIPDSFECDDGIKVNFFNINEDEKTKNNALRVVLVFDKTNYSEEEAKKKGIDLIKEIALSLAVCSKISCNWKFNTSSRWKKDEESKYQITKSLTICSRITNAINMEKTDNFKIREGLLPAFDFFNKALQHKEHSREREVAFWLYFTIEALAFDYGGKKKALENSLIENNVVNRKKINALNFSIGRHYRHHKTSGNGDILDIKECVNLVRNIIYFFNEKNYKN